MLDAKLDQIAAAPEGPPGVSVLIQRGGKLEYRRRGVADLDDTIGERLPGLLPRANRVTLRQALAHTGGLPDYIRDDAFIEKLQSDPAAYLSPRQLLRYVRDTPLHFRPGSRYEYSDTDNIVVGLPRS